MRDPRAQEILSVLVAEGRTQVLLRTDAWEDPAAWGILLVDLARHVANAYGGQQGAAQALARVKAGFDAEWDALSEQEPG
jgi:hypothetical protein